MKVRKRMLFSGLVQGVGFRWRCRQLAGPLGLTGRVENLWDGRVELELQGEDVALRAFLERLRAQPYLVIDRMEMEDLPLVDGERGFSVTGY